MALLPVLNNPDASDDSLADVAAFLKNNIRGEVRFDEHHRLLFSTDASLYQVKPLGVVFPEGADDVVGTLKYCSNSRIAILPRGGGTSLAGQCTNRAIVMDFSRMCRRVLSID